MLATEVATCWHYWRQEICIYAARTLYFRAHPCPLTFKTGGARAPVGYMAPVPMLQRRQSYDWLIVILSLECYTCIAICIDWLRTFYSFVFVSHVEVRFDISVIKELIDWLIDHWPVSAVPSLLTGLLSSVTITSIPYFSLWLQRNPAKTEFILFSTSEVSCRPDL